MPTLQSLLFVSICCLVAMQCNAAQPAQPSKLHNQCVSLLNDRTAAIVGRDWPELERLAERFTRTCRQVFGLRDNAKAFEEIATAALVRGNARKSLTASDTCISIVYASSGCHMQRALALAKLNRPKEAMSALQKAEVLITHSIEGFENDVARATSRSERKLAEAYLRNAIAEREHAAAIRNSDFPSQ